MAEITITVNGMSANLCRCTGYQGILRAVRQAATALAEAPA